MSLLRFGSDIRIDDMRVGFSTGLKYAWTAHADAVHPETIFINKHRIWFEFGSKRLLRKLVSVCSHESIHNILWHRFKIKDMTSHDRIIQPFRRRMRKEMPKQYKNDYYMAI